MSAPAKNLGAMQAAAASSGNTQALSTTAAQLALFDDIATNVGLQTQSDYSVNPDKANNRLKVECPQGPGAPTILYRVFFRAVCSLSTAVTLTFRLRKNGSAVSGFPRGHITAVANAKAVVDFEGILAVTPSDSQGTSGIALFDDPPAGGAIGAAFAPKSAIALDIDVAAGSGTPTLTLDDVLFGAERIN